MAAHSAEELIVSHRVTRLRQPVSQLPLSHSALPLVSKYHSANSHRFSIIVSLRLCTMAPSTRKNPTPKAKKSAENLDKVRKAGQAHKARNVRNLGTQKAYSTYIKGAREWMKETLEKRAATSSSQGPPETSEDPDDPDAVWDDPDFANAFGDIPNHHSPEALELYITWKVIMGTNGRSTADLIHAAWKAKWKSRCALFDISKHILAHFIHI